METVLYGIKDIFLCLLPVAGVIALVYVALFLKKLIETLKEVDKTLVLLDDQVKKLDAPLATVEDLSHTVDEVHHATKDAAKSAAKSASENITNAKTWINEKKEDGTLKKDAMAVKDWFDDKSKTVKEKGQELQQTVSQKRVKEFPVYHDN